MNVIVVSSSFVDDSWIICTNFENYDKMSWSMQYPIVGSQLLSSFNRFGYFHMFGPKNEDLELNIKLFLWRLRSTFEK